MNKIKEVLDYGKLMLKHISNGELDAAVLLAHVLNIKNWRQLLIMKNENIDDELVSAFKVLLDRRKSFEPVAMIVGCKEFWSLDFKVTPDTLVPRPETELLIELVQKYFPDKDKKLSILDLGTGSGCLLVTLLHEYHSSCGIGVDVSVKAIKVAHENAVLHGVNGRSNFVESNWLTNVPLQKFDVVVSNPPYITANQMGDLQQEVVRFEPHQALTDFSNGLVHYRNICESLPQYMHEGSCCFIEFGMGQGDDIAALISANGCKVIERKNDLSGIERSMVWMCK